MVTASTSFEAFGGIAQHGADHAAATLSRWLHLPGVTGRARVEVLSLDQVAADESGPGAAITLAARVAGALPGTMAIGLSPADAGAVIARLGGAAAAALGEMERSMLQETANIAFSSLMNGMARHLGLEAVPRAPVVVVDLGAAAWSTLLIEAAECADEAVVVSAEVDCGADGPRLRLVFLPAPAALGLLRGLP